MRFFKETVSLLALIGGVTTILPSVSHAQTDGKPLCLYIASYHPGYAWSDGVERGLRDNLSESCEIAEFYMDTKRKKTSQNKTAAGHAAYEMIKDLQPDVIITSDDNAAKYLIVPHLIDGEIPVVFSGINWTVEEYGFPTPNVTGIVEVAPIKPMLLEGVKASDLPGSQGVSVAYLGAMTLSEIKNFERVKSRAESLGMQVDSILADTFDTWKHGFKMAQQYDLVVMGSNSGIVNFEATEAKQWVATHTRKLSMTNHEWMMPYTAIGYTKVPEEHGEWAAASAVAILSGVKAIDIPLVTNRQWDTWINTQLLENTGVRLEDTILKKAKKYQ